MLNHDHPYNPANYEKVSQALSGTELDEVVEILAYMLADAIAQYSDYEVDQELFMEGGAMYTEAYKFVCTTDTITH
jgi:hypothetical protein